MAQVTQRVWAALIDESVTLTLEDGSEVGGRLLSADDEAIILAGPAGVVIEVELPLITDVVLGIDATTIVVDSGDVSLKDWYISLNPSGVLQFGPVLRAGRRISSNTYLNANFRLLSLGLLFHTVAAREVNDSVSPWSSSAGLGVQTLIPLASRALDRIYLGGDVSLSWQSITDGEQGNEEQMVLTILTPSAGVRWRFPSGLFIDMGVAGGVAIELWSRNTSAESETSVVETFGGVPLPIGWLEISIGWEF